MLCRQPVEVRSAQDGIGLPYPLFELVDPPVVERLLQPQNHLGVPGVEPPPRSESEVVPDPREQARADAGIGHRSLHQEVENAVGRALQ